MRTALTIVIAFLCVADLPLRAQGTIQFGFEEFPVESTPPFVSLGFQGSAKVYGPGTGGTPYQPLEGQRYLLSFGEIHLASADGQPIQSFTLHAFYTGANLSSLYIGGPSQIPIFVTPGSWQTIQAAFESPVPYIRLACHSIETTPNAFGIDSVQLVTVPEPRTSWLLGLGLGAILFRHKLRRFRA